MHQTAASYNVRMVPTVDTAKINHSGSGHMPAVRRGLSCLRIRLRLCPLVRLHPGDQFAQVLAYAVLLRFRLGREDRRVSF